MNDDEKREWLDDTVSLTIAFAGGGAGGAWHFAGPEYILPTIVNCVFIMLVLRFGSAAIHAGWKRITR